MTGYGKAECICGNNKITIEIKSVNGKGADISLKTQIVPRDKEIEIKQLISSKLQRGNIDLFANTQYIEEAAGRSINTQVFHSYIEQLRSLTSTMHAPISAETLVSAALRLPDVIEASTKKDESEEELALNWNTIKNTILEAVEMLIGFRKTEGKKLQEDLTHRISLILEYLETAQVLDSQRTATVKERLKAKIEEAIENPDMNRFEQEIIYYLEKLDITEEKVRLKQHCNYFLGTLSNEEFPGKKLGFISQEIGREINTLGSKANDAGIQKIVVQMKDELEKIKEQSLNIL